MTPFEIVLTVGAVIVLVSVYMFDVKQSKKPNKPVPPKPQTWDKYYED
jgi:hypothetical protein